MKTHNLYISESDSGFTIEGLTHNEAIKVFEYLIKQISLREAIASGDGRIDYIESVSCTYDEHELVPIFKEPVIEIFAITPSKEWRKKVYLIITKLGFELDIHTVQENTNALLDVFKRNEKEK